MDGLDHDDQGLPPLPLAAARSLPPSIVASGGNLQRLAQQADRPPVLVLVDEAEGHIASLAKNAAAFFRMSRSAKSRLFSARRRRFSSSKGESFPQPEMANRVLQIPLVTECATQVRVDNGILGLEFEGAAKVANGPLQVPRFLQSHSQ